MSASLRRFVILPALVFALVGAMFVSSSSNALAWEWYNPPIGGVLQRVGADLVVANASEGYSRAGRFTSVTVRNDGNAASTESHVGFAGMYAYVPALNVGQSHTVRLYRGSYCEISGTIMADAFNEAYEHNESNNGMQWIVIC
jgi:hypothetical protein